MELKINQISDHDWKSISGDWDSLLTRSQSNNPFLLWDWMDCWRTHLGSGKEFWFLSIKDGEKWVGAAPFCLERKRGVRMLQVCSSYDLYPDYLDIVAEQGHEKEVAEAVSNYLLRESSRWDMLSFDSILENSVLMRLPVYMGSHCQVLTQESSRCPYVKTVGSYDTYMAEQFNSKKRYNLQRQVKQLMEKNGCVLTKVHDAAFIRQSVRNLFDLNNRRAEMKEIKSSLSRNEIENFHSNWAARALEKGILDFHFIEKDGRPVSAAYAFRYTNKIYYYQSGMDPDWQSLSVGMVLLTLLIRSAFSSEVREFDFLKGKEKYKRAWMTGERTEYRLQVFNSSFAGRAVYLLTCIKRFLKKRILSKSHEQGV